ncbi:MAG: DegT/DnrJ/EryC1/StrS family aminotransferase [Clostridia bacterium]
MMIPANDLKRPYELHAAEYEARALEVLRSGWYVLGEQCKAFEQEFSTYTGAKHCVGLASGLDALWIALRLLHVGAGDEVIVCSNAYIACVMAITVNGATPVFVEPDEYNNLDASKLEAAVTPRTKAILPVHLYGQTCDMSKIMDIAHAHDLRVVEDCAQSHGSTFLGRQAGTFGDIGCYSFYPTKNLGAFGDAGCIITNSDSLADACRAFRNYGSRQKYQNEVVGANSRLDELQAGLLRVKLAHLNELTAEREAIAERYLSELSARFLTLPAVRPHASCTWHQFVIHSPHRNALRAFLAAHDIGSEIHYPIPPHLSNAYHALGYHAGDFPIAEQYANEVLSLPMFNGLTQNEQSRVIETVNAFQA